MSKTRFLAVDDELNNLLLVQHCLAHYPDYEVVTCTSGQEVLDRLYQGEKYDALLADWSMPAMSGHELVTTVRANPKYAAIRIMMLTAKTEMEDVKVALNSGANEYLMKPFTKDMLIGKLDLLMLP